MGARVGVEVIKELVMMGRIIAAEEGAPEDEDDEDDEDNGRGKGSSSMSSLRLNWFWGFSRLLHREI